MRMAVLIALLTLQPIAAAAQPASALVAAESKRPHSSVSVLVEPQLNDGRLVVRIAAKNLGATPASFGPSSVRIAKPSGETIALYPLEALVDDVRAAAGMAPETASAVAPTQGAYAAPQVATRDGRPDVSNYTGGSAVGGDEYIRRNHQVRRGKPTISEADAQSQIVVLKQAILQEKNIGSAQIAAGQIVSDKLKFKKGEDRTLHLRIRFAGDEHGFTIKAPPS
jgi:hypothetical protein